MNNKTNYSLIGFLVLFSITMMLGFAYWLLKPTKQDEIQSYHIYFDESVLGLNLDAPVKYKGITVGKVKKLKINNHNYNQVEVLVSVLKSTPIKSTTVATLTSQGITGLSYINLSIGKSTDPILKIDDEDNIPVILTAPSLFVKLEKTLGNVSINLSKTLARTQQLLNEKNQVEITALLKNSAEFMDRMNKLLDDDTINNLHVAIKNVKVVSEDFDDMIINFNKLTKNTVEWENKVSNAFKSIMGSYDGIKKTMDLFKKSLARGDFNLKEISATFVPTLNNTLLQTQELMIKLQDAVNQYERSPGNMLLIREEIKKGPGE